MAASAPRNGRPISAPTSSGVNGPSPPTAPLLALGDLGQQAEPAAELLAHGRGERGIRPAGGDHLLEDPDVAGLEVLLEEVAGPLPLAPERLRCRRTSRAGAAAGASFSAARTARMSCCFAAEVVVDLAERDAGRLGDAARGQVRVAVGEQARPRRVEDRGAGVGASRPRRSARVLRASRSRPWPSIRPPLRHRRRTRRPGSRTTPSGRREPAAPGHVLLDRGQGAEGEHGRQAAEPDAEHHEHQRPAAADAERAVGDAHGQRLTPLGRAAPAVHHEPERAAALVEAAVAERAELPQPGDEQGRGDDQLRVLGEPRQGLDRGVDRRDPADQAARPKPPHTTR